MPAVSADSVVLNDRILQSELKQQQIRSTTQRVNDQLLSIVEEFQRNAIGGEDVTVLKAIQSVLGKLSEKDMARIVDLLQEARSQDDSTTMRKRLLDADSGQKTVIVKLKQLLDEYRRQQALHELAMRFAQLAERQNANLKEAVWLEPLVRGKTVERYAEAQQIPWRQQVITQEAIKDEVELALTRLDNVIKQALEADNERPRQVQEMVRKGGLDKSLQTATGDLNGGRILSAAGNEKRVRDVLRDISRRLVPPKDLVESLRRAILELEQAMAEQSSLLKLTAELGKTIQESSDVADRQLGLGDRTDMLRTDLAKEAPAASATLKEAVMKMQDAHATLSGREGRYRRDDAKREQQAAYGRLEAARLQLQQQLAKAEEDARREEGALAQLRDLLRRLKELVAEQARVKDESASMERDKRMLVNLAGPKQNRLKERVQLAQSDAAAYSEKASGELNEAATQMDKAFKSISKEVNAPANQLAAIDAMKRAEAELLKALAKLDDAKKELSDLELALKRLIETIKQQQEVQLGTVRLAARLHVALAETAPLSARQAGLTTETGEIQKLVGTNVATATKHLGDAVGFMASSKTHLDLPSAKDSLPEQEKALANLFLAKGIIESRIKQLEQELKVPQDNTQQMAEAASQIDRAQAEINQALSQMSLDAVKDQLKKQQRDIAENLAQHEQQNPQEGMKQAKEAAQEAVSQLAQEDLPKAVAAMQKTQEAMARAQDQQNKAAGETKKQPETASAKPESPVPAENKPTDKPSEPATAQKEPAATPAAEKNAATAEKPANVPPSLDQLQKQQAEVQKAVQAMIAAPDTPPPSAMEQAQASLENAAQSTTAAATTQDLPTAAQNALQQAQQALTQAAGDAAKKQAPDAQKKAAQAQAALAQAAAALSMAQAGMDAQMAQDNSKPEGEPQPGEEQEGMQSKVKAGEGDAKNTQNKEQSKAAPTTKEAKNTDAKSQGNSGNFDAQGGADGPKQESKGISGFLGLPQRDRAALQQSQSEKYPQEYGTMVEQYLKNLADEVSNGK